MSALDDLHDLIVGGVNTGLIARDHKDAWSMLELLAAARKRECDMYIALSECTTRYPGVEGAMAQKRARQLLEAPGTRPASLDIVKPPVDVPAPVCRNCAGQGWEPSVGGERRPCAFCATTRPRRDPCTTCGGAALIGGSECPTCDGTGRRS